MGLSRSSLFYSYMYKKLKEEYKMSKWAAGRLSKTHSIIKHKYIQNYRHTRRNRFSFEITFLEGSFLPQTFQVQIISDQKMKEEVQLSNDPWKHLTLHKKLKFWSPLDI